jgi:acyl-coenzyme A thioesterase PaaI-like protein
MSAAVEGRERLRAALARLLDVFVAREATQAEFELWAGIVEEHAARIEATQPEGVAWGVTTNGVFSVAALPREPGVASTTLVAGERARTVATFGKAHEGHDGSVHGGVIATVFDELLGTFRVAARPRVVTAELTVRYLEPMPVTELVEFEAELSEVEGRKLRGRGWARRGATVFAEAEALFVERRE